MCLKFYARRLIKLKIIILIITSFLLLTLPQTLHIYLGISLTSIIFSILQYYMIYIEIGADYITLRTTLLESQISVLFDEIKFVKYECKKIQISYCNRMTNEESILKINLNVLENSPKKELLDTLYTIFINKKIT